MSSGPVVGFPVQVKRHGPGIIDNLVYLSDNIKPTGREPLDCGYNVSGQALLSLVEPVVDLDVTYSALLVDKDVCLAVVLVDMDRHGDPAMLADEEGLVPTLFAGPLEAKLFEYFHVRVHPAIAGLPPLGPIR